MLPAEAVTLRWVSGTIFGRAVVPEVCSTSATSSLPARPGCAAFPASPPSRMKQPAPLSTSGTSSSTGTPNRCATARAGVSTPRCTTSARAFRSVR